MLTNGVGFAVGICEEAKLYMTPLVVPLSGFEPKFHGLRTMRPGPLDYKGLANKVASGRVN